MSRPTPTADSTRITLANAPFDGLFPSSFTGREALNSTGEFRVRAIGAAPPVALSGMTGQHATLSLVWGETPRVIDAVCTRAALLPSTVDASHYSVELRSWLWLLTLASDNRVFQGKTTQQIIEAVFKGHNAIDYSFSLTGNYEARDWCVQYAETDFSFVSRLCEEEGWFYFFQHQSGKHTLVIADSNDAFEPLPGSATLAYAPGTSGLVETGQILYCEIVEQTATGILAHSDYAFLTPASQLYSQAQADPDAPTVYEYPGRYETSAAASAITKRRIDALRTVTRRLIGESDCRALMPGYKFTLTGHDSEDANISWVVSSVVHDADHHRYGNRFEAFPASTTWRPERVTRRPLMSTQTATVVGKDGEELWTDQYGRVKVQFHWDRDGKNDEQSSCWIRVAQPWASKRFGMQFMPRIGDEVVVTFIDGDPDRPLVTGSVYNGANQPPYTLPDNQTQSGIKTSSSKGNSQSTPPSPWEYERA